MITWINRDCSTAAFFERYKIIQIGLGKYAWEINKGMSCSRISVCKHFERWEPCIHVQHGEVTISIWVRAAFLPTDVKNVHSQTKNRCDSIAAFTRTAYVEFCFNLGKKKIEKGKNNLWKLGPWTIWANRPVDSLECLCRQRTYDVPWPKRIEAVWIQLEQLEPMPRRLDMPVSYIPQRAVVLSTMLPKSPRLRRVQVLNEWRYCPGIRFRWDLEDFHDLKNVRSQKRSKNTENFKKQAGMEAGNCDAKTPRSCEDGKANKSDDDCALCKEILGPNPLFENALPRSSPLKQKSSQIKHDLLSRAYCCSCCSVFCGCIPRKLKSRTVQETSKKNAVTESWTSFKSSSKCVYKVYPWLT